MLSLTELRSHGSATAIVGSSSGNITYTELADRVEGRCREMGTRRRLVLVEVENELEPLVTYLAALHANMPVMLVPATGGEQPLDSILTGYQPELVYRKSNTGWRLNVRRDEATAELHPDLSVLLSTSGSTGTAKFVRLSRSNLDANARSIVKYLGIVPEDCAATTLPFHYSYGLSVVNSHFKAGARLMLTNASVIEPAFWEDCLRYQITSFAGVPYTFELLERVGFADKHLPHLRYFTQAGGRLSRELVAKFDQLATHRGWQFFVMYGQTEATARISYVPPSQLRTHPESIGVPIPDGDLYLLDERGGAIRQVGITGELVYRGPNVMMGYASSRVDLGRGKEMEELRTGDLATIDSDGMFTIVGRKKRFVKLYGLRVSLEEVEKKLTSLGFRGIATGEDGLLVVATLDIGRSGEIQRALGAWLQLPPQVIAVTECKDYPLLPSGKFDYTAILQAGHRSNVETKMGSHELTRIFSNILGETKIDPRNSFVDLGGDSLSYIRASVAVERSLGYLPEGWERKSLVELEALPRKKERTSWSLIEMSVFLRALAILSVVNTHVGTGMLTLGLLPGIPGGTHVLMLISGFGFSRFHGTRSAKTESMRPIFHYLAQILPAYWIITMIGIRFLKLSNPLGQIFLFATFFPQENLGFWFIETLVHINLLLGVALLIPKIRHLYRTAPFAFSIGLWCLEFPMAAFQRYTTGCSHNSILGWSWIFALGMAVPFAISWRRRLFIYVLVLTSSISIMNPSDLGWLVGGGALLLLFPRVLLPVRFAKAVSLLAKASLFIYLGHMLGANTVTSLFRVSRLEVRYVAAIATGIVLYYINEQFRKWRVHRNASPNLESF